MCSRADKKNTTHASTRAQRQVGISVRGRHANGDGGFFFTEYIFFRPFPYGSVGMYVTVPNKMNSSRRSLKCSVLFSHRCGNSRT